MDVVVVAGYYRHADTLLPTSLLLVALLEPSFQTLAAIRETPIVGAPRPYDTRVVAYDWLHVGAINVCQLYLFRRFGFVSMWTFRVVYYVIWHIMWGHVRLGVLF